MLEAVSMSLQKKEDDFDVDPIIEKLMSVRFKAPGATVRLDLQTEIFPLIKRAGQIIEDQPMLLRLKAPLVVGTDIHGQYYDLLRFMDDVAICIV